MNKEEYKRYNRQLILPEIGVDGQEKIIDSKVLIVGMGGLGSPIATYLAACGVGTIGLVEFDTVDLSNLQRQIIYSTSQIGKLKVQVAEQRLRDINPNTNIIKYNNVLTEKNYANIFANFDYIIDATDNLATRYLINDASISLGKKYVYGSIYNFEGKVSIFGAKDGPCYRCLFPEPPNAQNIPGSLELGVFGILPGVIGAIQATEVIKLICGVGEPLIGKLLIYDALDMVFKKVNIRKNPNCPICSKTPNLKIIGNYHKISNLEPKTEEVEKIEVKNAYTIFCNNEHQFIFLDIRDFCERKKTIPNSIHIPIHSLKNRMDELDKFKDKCLIVYCQEDSRSILAAKVLLAYGYKVFVLDGGMYSWMYEKLPLIDNI
ncbi:HesA/MoeB/ThiF family protein [Propionispora vibrioides]|uniref:Adenylyltransferase and sulfurtransferase n=1 Tax=Propionispora vibrioides TaxID=112903 RepID=A0A1H8XD88_9FIRM|nr:HesA/MoeB/ThiF family protein [Propionispora vibrioides]SEP37762.1 adenylyltransferase and sulfurtransferase [Propionispora vibrioides]